MRRGRVLVAGGGTGGHVFPSLAVADALRVACPELDIEFVGTAHGLESRLVPAAGWRLHVVPTPPLPRRPSLPMLRVPFALTRAVRAVVRLIRTRDVRAAVVFGGYVAVPLVLAARITRTPLIVHEQNAVPGVANRLAARWAQAAAVSFPGSVHVFSSHVPVTVTGNPVRPALAALAGVGATSLRAEAVAAFGLDPARRTLLVFGGSQGAARLNDAITASAWLWQEPARLQIVHATGPRNHDAVRQAWEPARSVPALRVRCEPFIERMDLAYSAADLVVSRAGATTVAELTVLGVPSVLVPYPHATANHQAANAHAVAEAGAAIVVPDADLDAPTLVAVAEPLLRDDARRAGMAAAAAAWGRPDAAEHVAALVVAAVRGHGSGERSRV